MRALIVAAMIMAASGCAPTQPVRSSMHDYYVMCEKPDGTYYDVEVEDGTCRPGEFASRCALPDGTVVGARTPEECKARGGRLLGVR
jgi:hypothetical protein